MLSLSKHENDILRIAALVEKGSEHPIGKAVVKEAMERKLDLNLKVEGFPSLSRQRGGRKNRRGQ